MTLPVAQLLQIVTSPSLYLPEPSVGSSLPSVSVGEAAALVLQGLQADCLRHHSSYTAVQLEQESRGRPTHI